MESGPIQMDSAIGDVHLARLGGDTVVAVISISRLSA